MTRKSTFHHSAHFFYTSKKPVVKKMTKSELKSTKYIKTRQKSYQVKKPRIQIQQREENVMDIYRTSETIVYRPNIVAYVNVDQNNVSALLFCVIAVSLFMRTSAMAGNPIIHSSCLAQINFPTFDIPIICDYSIQNNVSDHEFFVFVSKLNNIIERAIETRAVKCKLEQFTSNKMNRVTIVGDERLTSTQPARYESGEMLISKNNFFNNESEDIFRHELHHAYLEDRFDKTINAKKFVKDRLPTPVDTSNKAELDRYVRLLGRGINRINKVLRQVEDNIITVDPSWHEDTIRYQPRVMKTLVTQKWVDELLKEKRINSDLSLKSDRPLEVGKPLFQLQNSLSGFLDKHKATIPVYVFSIEKFNNQYLATIYSVPNLHNKLESALKDILLIIDHGYKFNPHSIISQTAEIEAYLHQLLEKMPAFFGALFGELLDWQFEKSTPEFKTCMTEKGP